MVWALHNKMDVDAIVILTDNETWFGQVHPMVALQKYRQVRELATKLVVVGMTATEFTIADPNDGGSLDVVGFDTAAPQLISDFIGR
jgi:60 kDa SS-A/Ro ribonucleoprotein